MDQRSSCTEAFDTPPVANTCLPFSVRAPSWNLRLQLSHFNKHADSFKSFQGSKQVPTSSTVLLVLSVRVYPCVNFSLQYSLGGCDTL